MSSMSFPSYNPLTNGITTGAFGVVSFNIVGPDVGVVVAANACLFTANGEARIVAITIIAAIVVVVVFFKLVFVFVGVISTMDGFNPMLLIKRKTNSTYGIQIWYSSLVL